MGKKLTALLLLALMLAGGFGVGPARAELPEDVVKIECLAGSTATLSSNVIAGSRVYGMVCSDSAAGSCAGFDTAAAADVSGGTTFSASGGFVDVRVTAGTGETILFPYPKKIATGYVAWNSAATGTQCVYYR